MSVMVPDERFRLVVEAAPNAMILVDRRGAIVFANAAAEGLFDYPRAELVGRSIDSLIPERFRRGHGVFVEGFFAEPRARAMGTGRDLFGRRKDGAEIPIEIGLNPIEMPNGLCTLASIIDISERKRAEERFRLTVEAAPNAMLMIDAARVITLVNRSAEALFGYDRSELLGQPLEMLVPERFRGRHPGQVERFFSTPKTRSMGAGRDLFGRRKDGTEVPIEIGLNPIESPQGLFTLASIIDITERKRADELQERLVAIVEHSEDAIISTSLDGVITSWNGAAERLFGFSAIEVIGKPGAVLLPESQTDEDLQMLERIRVGERIPNLETLRRRKDGREIDVSLTLSPMHDAFGTIIGAAMIARDITALRRKDAELRRSNAELEQFAYIASHDLQEPLRMVANYTELLGQRYRGKLDAKADTYIHYAVDGAKRMQQLVADLLAYSRVGSQGKPIGPVSAGAVLDVVLDSIRGAVRDAGAVVEIPEPLPTVHADEVQLRQLFQNLLGNAIKFRGEEPPRIVVAAVVRSGSWLFSVKDNGIGLEETYTDRIFQMFQRLHERGRYEGSGIGLTIAKRIVERHGGRIWVKSTPGNGATFFFTLPVVPRQQ
jgi:PAS domain S-box-containing protein